MGEKRYDGAPWGREGGVMVGEKMVWMVWLGGWQKLLYKSLNH